MVKRVLVTVCAVLVLAIGLSGCGGQNERAPTDAKALSAPPPGDLPTAGAPGGPGLGRFDKNGDGVIEAEEVPEPSRARVMSADADGDGKVTQAELAGGQGRMREMSKGGAHPSMGAEMIERHDANKDGRLSADEMPEAVRARLMPADKDGDGMVSAEEADALQRAPIHAQ